MNRPEVKPIQPASQLLLDLGFSNRKSASLPVSHPHVFQQPRRVLEHNFENLVALGFRLEELKTMVAQIPEILTVQPNQLRKNFINLLKELGDRNARLAAIQGPEILTQNPLSVSEKVDYCLLEMGLSKDKIAKSGILCKGLDLIRIRHGLAYRSGYYKKPEKSKKSRQPTIDENPSVADLLRTTDEAFVAQFKGLTMEDLVVFEDMMREEHRHSAAHELADAEDQESDAEDEVEDEVPNNPQH